MPSATHESVVALFRECPALAPELLRVAECTPPAASTTPRVISAEFADLDDFILASLGEAARRVLEEKVMARKSTNTRATSRGNTSARAARQVFTKAAG